MILNKKFMIRIAKMAAPAVLLLQLVAFGCKKDSTHPREIVPKAELTQRILDSTGLIANLFSDTSFVVVPGVEETDLHFQNEAGYSTHVYLLKVDLNHEGIRLQAGTPYGSKPFALQTVPVMAQYLDSAGNRVVAGLNADFFSTVGEPRGIAIKDGKILKTTWANARSASFVGVKDDGAVFIGNREDFDNMKDVFRDALGAGQILVWNNAVQVQTDVSIEPRTAVGINENGIMVFAVVDGRSFYYSNGISITDLGILLKACGSTTVVNLDGGGSSTFMIKHPLAPVWQVRNRPSDGNNRAVGNSWMIIADQP